MNKKYLPFVALIAAALLFFWVKQHQRGNIKKEHTTINTNVPQAKETFDRNTAHLVYSKHAKCRMDCRHIDEAEVKEILLNGELNNSKIEHSDKGWTYPIEGFTKDKQHVRIVFAPHEEETVVVTVIDLDKEWQCDCN